MTSVQDALLAILKNITSKEKRLPGFDQFTDWDMLYSLSAEQQLLPLVFDSSYPFLSSQEFNKEQQHYWKKHALQLATRQITQTNEFLTLLLHAQAQGLDPVVVKGITVRSLYPQPCLRPSVDEDLLIPTDDVIKWHKFLLSENLFADDLETATELSYHKENSPTYIELHMSLFDPQSDAYGDFNDLFPDVFSHTVRIQIEDVSVRTLEPSAHLLYLVLHAFKHFVHSGIGIRPICDIGIFTEHYRDEINWNWIRSCLEKVNAFYYCRALLRIVQLYLLPDAKFFQDIADWNLDKINVEPLLEDVLASGVHGNSSMARLHSSNMTLEAASRNKKHRKNGILSSLFPGRSYLKQKYPYIQKHPLLLPIAWMQRILGYLKQNRKDNLDPAKSVRIGSARIKLLEQYHII